MKDSGCKATERNRDTHTSTHTHTHTHGHSKFAAHKGEDWDEVAARLQRELDESIALLQIHDIFLGVTVQRLCGCVLKEGAGGVTDQRHRGGEDGEGVVGGGEGEVDGESAKRKKGGREECRRGVGEETNGRKEGRKEGMAAWGSYRTTTGHEGEGVAHLENSLGTVTCSVDDT